MPRTLTAMLFLLCGGAAATAQLPPPAPGPGPASGPGPQIVRRMPGPIAAPAFTGNEARLPMTFEQGIPVVEIFLNGRGPYRFAIDTGAAGHGRVRSALAGTLGLAVAGEMRAGDGSGRSQTRRSFAPVDITLGGVAFRGVQLSEMPVLPGRLDNVDGILGLHLFAGHLLTLDYAGRQVALSTASLPDSAMPFSSARGLIVIPVTIGAATIPAHVDTGNAIAPLLVPASAVQALPTSGEPRRAGAARTGVSTVDIWEADLTAPVLVGNATAPILTVRYPSPGENANLGSLALAAAVLRIDQRNRRIEIRFAESGERGMQ